MAKGRKTGGRDIKRGQVLNPVGRIPDPPGLKALKDVNRAEWERLLQKVMTTPKGELEKLAADPSISAMEAALYSIMIQSINSGDDGRLEFFLRRKIGPVPTIVTDPAGNSFSFLGLVALAQSKEEPDGES